MVNSVELIDFSVFDIFTAGSFDAPVLLKSSVDKTKRIN